MCSEFFFAIWCWRSISLLFLELTKSHVDVWSVTAAYLEWFWPPPVIRPSPLARGLHELCQHLLSQGPLLLMPRFWGTRLNRIPTMLKARTSTSSKVLSSDINAWTGVILETTTPRVSLLDSTWPSALSRVCSVSEAVGLSLIKTLVLGFCHEPSYYSPVTPSDLNLVLSAL